MLHHAVIFVVIALVTAVLGFSGIATGLASIARVLFIVCSLAAIVSVLFTVTHRA